MTRRIVRCVVSVTKQKHSQLVRAIYLIISGLETTFRPLIVSSVFLLEVTRFFFYQNLMYLLGLEANITLFFSISYKAR